MKKVFLFCFLLNCCSINIIHAQLFGGLIKSSNVQAVFSAVTIGTQQWMEKNLEVVTYRDGTVIPEVTDATAWVNLTTGAWCYYENTTANGTTYGKLYNWYAVAGIWDEASKIDASLRKKLAPTGCHVPTHAEWSTLTTYLGGESVAGGKMKATGTSLWLSPNTSATNSSGFTGLPGGYRYSNGTFGKFNSIGVACWWWSSSENNTTYCFTRYLHYSNGEAYTGTSDKREGISVRCLRD